MKCAVKSRSNQVVHSGVNDDELFAAALFCVEDAGEQNSGVGSDGFARFEDEFEIFLFEQRDDAGGIIFCGRNSVGFVVCAVASAEVEGFDSEPF